MNWCVHTKIHVIVVTLRKNCLLGAGDALLTSKELQGWDDNSSDYDSYQFQSRKLRNIWYRLWNDDLHVIPLEMSSSVSMQDKI